MQLSRWGLGLGPSKAFRFIRKTNKHNWKVIRRDLFYLLDYVTRRSEKSRFKKKMVRRQIGKKFRRTFVCQILNIYNYGVIWFHQNIVTCKYYSSSENCSILWSISPCLFFFLPPAYAVEVMFSSRLCVCVCVCVSVCLGYNFWTSWHRNFIFGMMVHLDHI